MKHLAEKYHAGQFRKGPGNIPYIAHPRAVAEKLLSWGEEPASSAVGMAWGHDLLEDTPASDQEILAVSDEAVLAGIKMLTCPENMPKREYLQGLAARGGREVLLVKTADRLCNSGDFISLKGELYAFQYLHSADCLIPALEKISAGDPVVQNALRSWKELDHALQDKAWFDAICGSLLGGAAGDALGSPVEFLDKKSIRSLYGGPVEDYVEFGDGTGAITDDTQMTLFTAEGILRAHVRSLEKGICAPVAVMKNAYLRWLKTQGYTSKDPYGTLESGSLIRQKLLFSRRSPGNTCLNALMEDSPRAKNDSKGCGSVMRMAPVGLFLDPESAYEYGCKFSAITHGHPTGITAGGAFAMLISYLRYGKSLEEALDLVENHLEQFPDGAETLEAVRKARRAGSIAELGEGWVAEETLAIGIWCALHYTWDFRKGVLAAVNISGDSDSTGAVAGNILGVLNGEKAIPEKWRKNLREYSIVRQIACDLHKRFEETPEGCVTKQWWEKYPGF